MLGIGRVAQHVLDNYCIITIGDLANTNPDFLKCRLGKNGVALWQYANSKDHLLVHNPDCVLSVKSVGYSITIVEDLKNNVQVWLVFLELTKKIGHKFWVYQNVQIELLTT